MRVDVARESTEDDDRDAETMGLEGARIDAAGAADRHLTRDTRLGGGREGEVDETRMHDHRRVVGTDLHAAASALRVPPGAPGTSSAWADLRGRSRRRGCARRAATTAPRQPTSSCTVATARAWQAGGCASRRWIANVNAAMPAPVIESLGRVKTRLGQGDEQRLGDHRIALAQARRVRLGPKRTPRSTKTLSGEAACAPPWCGGKAVTTR
jgi:hypothetical protein